MSNSNSASESVVREIKRKTRRVFNAEEKIRIVLEGLRQENDSLKQLVAELSLKNRVLKKSLSGLE